GSVAPNSAHIWTAGSKTRSPSVREMVLQVRWLDKPRSATLNEWGSITWLGFSRGENGSELPHSFGGTGARHTGSLRRGRSRTEPEPDMPCDGLDPKHGLPAGRQPGEARLPGTQRTLRIPFGQLHAPTGRRGPGATRPPH